MDTTTNISLTDFFKQYIDNKTMDKPYNITIADYSKQHIDSNNVLLECITGFLPFFLLIIGFLSGLLHFKKKELRKIIRILTAVEDQLDSQLETPKPIQKVDINTEIVPLTEIFPTVHN